MSEQFDFKTVEAAKSVSYLKPGNYELSIVDAKYVAPEGTKPDGSPKSPYVEVYFEGSVGKLSDKFFISPGALGRIQYLCEAWIGKKIDKVFENGAQVGAYLVQLLTHANVKKITKKVTVGGTQGRDGKFYTNLPFSGFVHPEGSNFPMGEFKEGDYAWNQNVKMNNNASTSTNSVVITDDFPAGSVSNPVDNDPLDDLPF